MKAHLLDRPIWSALSSTHAPLAQGGPLAKRYLAEIVPFAAPRDAGEHALDALGALVTPGETILLAQADDVVLPDTLSPVSVAEAVQMIAEAPEPAPADSRIEPLTPADAAEMLALATLTRPGPFSLRALSLGRFWGIRQDGRLAAMAGERLRQPGFTELSGVCSHPELRGRGLGRTLSLFVTGQIGARGDIPYLHGRGADRFGLAVRGLAAMWDFSIGTSLGLVARTWPFVLLRLVVYACAALGIVVGTGLGATGGWIIGLAFGAGAGGAVAGGFIGCAFVLGVLWWVRQYLVYLVKAGHVAAMDALLHGGAVPGGRAQINHATATVKQRFLEVNILFGIDLLIRGTVRAFVSTLGLLTNWIPGMRTLNAFLEAVLRVALGLVDEIILAYIIRHDRLPPGEAARDGLVLYAQNAGTLVRNAVWIALFEYALTMLIFLVLLGPALGLAYALPGPLAGFGVVFAFALAWALKAALIEPISIASLLQAYAVATDGQRPNPDWTARLDEASRSFRDLASPPMRSRAA